MMRYTKKWMITVLAACCIMSCNKDDDNQECPPCEDPSNPECENYDPCFGERPTSADFVIERRWAPGVPDSLSYVGGTNIFSRGILRFRALDSEASSYKWYLGAETITEPIFSRNFGVNVPFGTEITVSLVLTKNIVNTSCFPSDTGRDSVAVDFRIVSVCDFAVNNRFRGVYAHAPMDSVDIEFLFDLPNTGSCTGTAFSAFNLGNSGEWHQNISIPRAINNQLYFGGSGGATPKGYMQIDETTEIVTFDYEYFNANWEFTGQIYHE